MSAPKKTITERDRKRMRANQMANAIKSEKNELTQTNQIYQYFMNQWENEKLPTSPEKKFEMNQKSENEASQQQQFSDEEERQQPVIEAQDDSTGASQDSDSDSTGGAVQASQAVQRKEFLFAGSGVFIKYWNNVIIALALYNSLFIPLQIFYKDKGHSFLLGETVRIIDSIVDLIFLLDIVIKFRTTYLDSKQSVEVREPHKIGKRYLKGTFFIDFISSVPFASFAGDSEGPFTALLDALGLLKLLRLGRLYSTVQTANMPQDIKVYLKVIMMALILFISIHVLSCLWFAVS